MNDVFDEDLMRELGLDPEDIENVKKKPQETPQKKAAPQPSAAASQSVSSPAQRAEQPRPQAPRREPARSATPPKAPEDESTLHGEFLEDQDIENSPPPAKAVHREDPQAYSEKMTQNLPVHLAAVLAKKSVPLKDVIEMRIGEVIDFKKLPQDTIDLVANGKLVAKAELVMVDGRVGARIVKLLK